MLLAALGGQRLRLAFVEPPGAGEAWAVFGQLGGAAELVPIGQLPRRAVELRDARELDDELITLLAAGFAKGEQGAPAIPYAKLSV